MFQKISKHRANDASNDVHRPPLVARVVVFSLHSVAFGRPELIWLSLDTQTQIQIHIVIQRPELFWLSLDTQKTSTNKHNNTETWVDLTVNQLLDTQKSNTNTYTEAQILELIWLLLDTHRGQMQRQIQNCGDHSWIDKRQKHRTWDDPR